MLFARSFRGGIHPPDGKSATASSPIAEVPTPPEIIIHLHQHTGAPCRSLVAKGDKVLAGQKIGDAEAFITAPVHASVSGTVTAVEARPHFTGVSLAAVVIKPDEEQRRTRLEVPSEKAPAPEEVRRIVREAGIVGLGGAAFPTHVKLSPPKDKKVEVVIINGCECEPFLTCDHRNMLESAAPLMEGAAIIASAVAAKRVVIAVEDNKTDAAKALEKPARESGVEIKVLPTRYPQGAEKQLVKSILGREIPSGKLPIEAGALVQNVGTAIAVADAVRRGQPLISRTITVSGPGVPRPANLKAPIGTPIEFILSHCGVVDAAKVVIGGPMTGFAQHRLDVPTVKGTSGILAFPAGHRLLETTHAGPCIRCARCVGVCPMILMPNFLGIYARLENWDAVERYNVFDCIECGCCAWACPSRIPLVQLIKLAKAKILAARQNAK